jgi:nucleoside-diphosphate-sugar epimerase
LRVAVTGANGLLGGTLAALHVARGDDVRGLVRDTRRAAGNATGMRVCEGDLADSDADIGARLVEFIDGADVVYHCAAELQDPARMVPTNVDGTRRLLAAAAGRIGRWVQVGTVGVYGRPRQGTITEASPLAPADAYAESKARADVLVTELSAAGGFEHVILRACAVIGPGMPGRFLYRVIELLDRGLFAPVGAPGALVSLVPAANVAQALLACATLPQAAGRSYNLADQCTVEALVAVCCEALGRPAPRWRLPEAPLRAAAWLAERVAPGRLTQAQIDILTSRVRYATERIRGELGYREVLDLDSAIRDLVMRWRERKP